jgi:hypothetical protein
MAQDAFCVRLQQQKLSLFDMNSTLEAAADHMENFCDLNEGMDPYVSKYLRNDANIISNKGFYQGICKLQSGNPGQLSTEEKIAISGCLSPEARRRFNRENSIRSQMRRNRNSQSQSQNSEPELELFGDFEEEDEPNFEIDNLSPISKIRKLEEVSAMSAAKMSVTAAQAQVAEELRNYVDVGCIQGTTVNVERCFSIAKSVLTDIRLGMTPLMFEVYLYLYFNLDLWGPTEVSKAINGQKPLRREKMDAIDCGMEPDDGNDN